MPLHAAPCCGAPLHEGQPAELAICAARSTSQLLLPFMPAHVTLPLLAPWQPTMLVAGMEVSTAVCYCLFCCRLLWLPAGPLRGRAALPERLHGLQLQRDRAPQACTAPCSRPPSSLLVQATTMAAQATAAPTAAASSTTTGQLVLPCVAVVGGCHGAGRVPRQGGAHHH